MAYDKVIDSAQFEADLTAVADAIREKGETTALLAWPEEYIAAIGDISGGGSGGYPENVYDLAYTNEDDSITLTWTDTGDAEWAGTLIVAKQGSYPTDIDDGIVIVDSKTRDQYATEGYTYSGLAEGEWYLQAFPYSVAGEVSDNIVNRLPVSVVYIYPSPLASFKVSGGNTTATITYTLPEDATGVDVVYKAGGYPASMTDGTVLADVPSGYQVTGLTNDTTYYFRAVTKNSYGRYNTSTEGQQAASTPVEWDGTLFDAGNQYEDITGGWWQNPNLRYAANYPNTGTVTIGDTIRCVAGATTAALASTKIKIPLAAYSTAYITLTANAAGGASSVNAGLTVHENESGDALSSALVRVSCNSTGTFSLDISGVTQDAYISIGLNGGRSMTATKIWLE